MPQQSNIRFKDDLFRFIDRNTDSKEKDKFFLSGCVGSPSDAPELIRSRDVNSDWSVLPEPLPEASHGPATGRSRGVISRDSCRSNVTAQLGLAARMFCCLATNTRGRLGQTGSRISWVKMEDLSIISHHDTIFSTDKRISVIRLENLYTAKFP